MPYVGKAPCSSQKRLSFREQAGCGAHEGQSAVQKSLSRLAVGRHSGLHSQPVAMPILDTPAPMPPGCFTRVTRQRPILDRGVWHSDPLAIDEHFARRSLSSGKAPVDNPSHCNNCSPTCPSDASRCRGLRVGGSKLEQGDRCKELKLERHRPLSRMMGWRRSSERRETLLRLILLPTGDPVPGTLRNLHKCLNGTELHVELPGYMEPEHPS